MIALSARDMPEQVLILFWDVDLATLDLEDHKSNNKSYYWTDTVREGIVDRLNNGCYN